MGPYGTGTVEGRRYDEFAPSSGFLNDRQYGRSNPITVEIRPWDRRRIAKIDVRDASVRGIAEARRALQEENLRLEDVSLVMEPRFVDYIIRRDDEFQYYFKQNIRPHYEGEERVFGEILGMKVIVSKHVKGAIVMTSF